MTDLHPCPRCGRPTSGAWSEGGAKWAICEKCMEDEHNQTQEGDEAWRRQMERSKPDSTH